MFCIAVFEQENLNRHFIKEILSAYSLSKDLELEILWFTGSDAIEKVKHFAWRIQIALISTKESNHMEIGRQIYWNNADCLICYYSSTEEMLEPLLPSRPICFYRLGVQSLPEIIDDMTKDYARRIPTFRYDTRKIHFSVPIRNITYFQSDLKHVSAYYLDGSFDTFFGRLSDVQDSLRKNGQEHYFLRCHQSFLVNRLYIEKLDKSSSLLHLTNHEIVAVSRTQYPQVVKSLMYSADSTDSSILCTENAG